MSSSSPPFLFLLLLFLRLCSVSVSASGSLVTLNEDNWRQITKGEWMVEFYAPWCPACRALGEAWAGFAEWTDDLGLHGVAKVDVTENPGLSGRFLVTALPTIYHIKDGQFRVYRGARDKDSFISFVEDKKWKEVETVAAWKDPTSPQMALVAYFFKTSMLLRNVHTIIVEDYGYPAWVSYVIFAAATIILGALLGLILVCCIDCIYPPPKHHGINVSQKRKKKTSESENQDDDGAADEAEADESAEEEKEEAPAAPVVRKRRAKKAD